MRQSSPIPLALVAVVAACLLPVAASAGYCPRVLHRATRILIITVPDMNTAKGTLRTFERASPIARWTPRSESEPAVVGARGIAWGHRFSHLAKSGEPIKQEGDKRTPAGIYRLGAAFGFAKDDRAGRVQLAPGRHFCVDDVSSPLYGQIVARSTAGDKASGEDMAANALYRRGIFIEYPPYGKAKAGSCISLHVWQGEGIGTAGCVALPEARLAQLQDWSAERHTVIAIVSEGTAARFNGCLPSEPRVSANAGPAALPLPNPKRRVEASRAALTP